MHSFFVFAPQLTNGAFIATGDYDGDGKADIIAGAGTDGGPHVRVLRGTDLAELQSFFAFEPTFFGGVRVAGTDTDGDGRAELVVARADHGLPQLRIFDGATHGLELDTLAFDPTFLGGIAVAGTDRL